MTSVDFALFPHIPTVQQLTPFQNDLCGLLLYPSDRLFFVYDKIGGSGKSVWAKVVQSCSNCLVLRGGPGAELQKVFAQKLKPPGFFKHVVLDLTTGCPDAGSVLECLKVCEMMRDGLIPGTLCQTVIVFANDPSPLKDLSMRRWMVLAPNYVKDYLRLVTCCVGYDKFCSESSIKLTNNIFPPCRVKAEIAKSEEQASQHYETERAKRAELEACMTGEVALYQDYGVVNANQIAELLKVPCGTGNDGDKEK